MNKIVAIGIVATVAYFSFDYSKASERLRFYDTSKGWPKPTWQYADKQYDGSWRVYDSKGRLKSVIDKDRLYDRKGNVIEKFYLIPK